MIQPTVLQRIALICCAACFCTTLPFLSRAVDTLEPFDQGASDFELYVNADGIGKPADASSFAGDVIAGYGVLERVSAYLGAQARGDGAFTRGSSAFCVGAFGSALDSDHFDLDLVLDFGVGAAGLRDYAVTPALEINLDVEPDLALFGLFVVVGSVIHPAEVEETGVVGDRAQLDLPAAVGLYVTLGNIHQLLVQLGASFDDLRGDPSMAPATVSLGYNVSLVGWLELIAQVSLALWEEPEPTSSPRSDPADPSAIGSQQERDVNSSACWGSDGLCGFGVMLGAIATLP